MVFCRDILHEPDGGHLVFKSSLLMKNATQVYTCLQLNLLGVYTIDSVCVRSEQVWMYAMVDDDGDHSVQIQL